MAQRTSTDETLSRDELATYFTHLATQFDGDSEHIDIEVGNKSVTLSPSESIDVSIEVTERSSMLRGERETVDIELTWKP